MKRKSNQMPFIDRLYISMPVIMPRIYIFNMLFEISMIMNISIIFALLRGSTIAELVFLALDKLGQFWGKCLEMM